MLLLLAALEALVVGTELLAVLDNLARVRDRMKAEGRTEPLDEELDQVRGRIQARQDRIDKA